MILKDYLLRKIDNAINFDFIYKDVEELYSGIGRPSVDPAVLIKTVVIQYLFGIPSMRQTIKEIDKDRIMHGKKPLSEKENVETKEIIKSTIDPDARMFYKTEKEKCFVYLAYTICDDNNFILEFDITPGNVHDSVALKKVLDNVLLRYHEEISIAILYAGYVTLFIAKTIL